MKAIIFGANGQDGHYLNELCKLKGIEAAGVSRSGDWVHGDVSSYTQVKELIKKYSPSYIFHFAANSTTGHEALFENHETISTGTLNILEAARKHSPAAKIFITGSGVQFVNKGVPISEIDPFDANSPYAIARIQSVYAARYYRSLGLKAYVGYLFHHESPFRKAHHVSQMIALAAGRIAMGSSEMIEVGDLSVKKEWTFAGDVARGIFALLDQEDVFECVIGSGVFYSIENWLEECFKRIGRDWHDYVRLRDGFRSEYKCLISDPKTIHSLGWSPAVGFQDLAKMMIPGC